MTDTDVVGVADEGMDLGPTSQLAGMKQHKTSKHPFPISYITTVISRLVARSDAPLVGAGFVMFLCCLYVCLFFVVVQTTASFCWYSLTLTILLLFHGSHSPKTN